LDIHSNQNTYDFKNNLLNKQEDESIPGKEFKLENSNFSYFTPAKPNLTRNSFIFSKRNGNYGDEKNSEKIYFAEIPLEVSISSSELDKKKKHILTGREVVSQKRTNESFNINSCLQTPKRTREDLNKPVIDHTQSSFITPQKTLRHNNFSNLNSSQKTNLKSTVSKDFKILKEIERLNSSSKLVN